MKIAHLADLHLGYSHLSRRAENGQNQRQRDFQQAAALAAQAIIDEQVDLCLVAGDLLHETNMYPAAMSGAVSFCEQFQKAGIPLLAIGGNHDEAESPGRYNGLRFLASHSGLRLHLQQEHVDFAEARIHCVSFRVLSRAAGGRGEIMPFQFADDRANVLLAHGYASGDGVPDLPEERETEIPSAWLRDPRFAACLLGHVHHHGEIAPHVFYAGSTERRNFGEAKERPGFWLHEFSGGELQSSQSVFIDQLGQDTLPRPMIDASLQTAGLTLRELDQKVLDLFASNDIDGSMMRIVLHDVSSDLDRARSTASWEQEFRRAGGFYLETVVRTRQLEEVLSANFAPAPVDTQASFLDFLDKQDLGEDEKEIKKLAEEIMGEARDSIIAQETD